MIDWQNLAWVVWRINVDDPNRSASEEPDLAERTDQAMTELAATSGCVYENCVDFDSSEDGVPYYAWWFGSRRSSTPDAAPTVSRTPSKRCAATWPRSCPRAWSGRSPPEQTIDHAASSDMRALYEDLIGPFERALMSLRVDGADEFDPRAKAWKWEEKLLVGTFDLWLCVIGTPRRPTRGRS
ncbi:hypothetical protein [Embleya sp. NBC_00896]|uniref:hypothetical protein n=1 Tax=Embleya sp. NBC_00896 TaxID=2975961 RepID=UPI002F913722|nr:hypothetical protein OG928_46885 [Embleya sp. NBC_00896]